jgi:hypothetical protein
MSFSPFYFNPQGTGTAEALVSNYTNASLVTAIPQGQAVSVNGFGKLVPLDVTSQSSWQSFVGYAYVRIPAGGTGPVIANGRLFNITTAYTAGTALYIGTDANPTSIIPSDGVNGFVAGDIVIFLGVIVQNETNPSELDIALFTQFVDVL